jgi:hypothetical protein
VFITAIPRFQLGADDLRLAAEVRPCDSRKEFHGAIEGQSLGEPELQAPSADIFDGANQGFGRTALAHEATRHLDAQGDPNRPTELASATEGDVEIQTDRLAPIHGNDRRGGRAMRRRVGDAGVLDLFEETAKLQKKIYWHHNPLVLRHARLPGL